MKIGYAAERAGFDQNLNLQTDALERTGCQRIFTETASEAEIEVLYQMQFYPGPKGCVLLLPNSFSDFLNREVYYKDKGNFGF